MSSPHHDGRYGCVAAVVGACWQAGLGLGAGLGVAGAAWALLGGYWTLYLIYHTLPRDLV